MNRRDAIKLTSIIMGASVTAPAWLAALEGCSPEKTAGMEGSIFNENQTGIISEISNLLIPTTDTPGAIEAGVPDFIEKFVSDVYTDDQRNEFLKGLEEVDQKSKDKYGKIFMKIQSGQKEELVSQMNKDALIDKSKARYPRQGSFFLMIKEATLLGFFTSLPGATQTLQYLPIPGGFNGCMPLSEVGRQWATD